MTVLIKNTGKLALIIIILNSTIWMGCESKKNADGSPPEIITGTAPPKALSIDTVAVELLRRGLNFVSNLDQFSVQTQSTYEDVLEEKYRVDYETSASLLVKRPNKILIERFGLKMHQIFIYDGSSLSLNNPHDNVYAIEPVPENIEDMFHFVRDTFGISSPSSDLIYKNSFSLLIQDVNAASVIGKEMIGAVMCDHLLFSRPDVSFQIWMSENEPYLPYKYVVTDTSTPQLLSYSTVMNSWNTAPNVSESLFKFTPGKESKKITLLKVGSNTQ